MKHAAPFKRTAISQMTDAIVNNGMMVDQSHDAEILAQSKERWEDLDSLCNEVGGALLELLTQVEDIQQHPHITQILGPNQAEFDRHVQVFHKDMLDFTTRMADAKKSHEGKVGVIQSLEDMNEFGRLSMLYLSVSNEINSILGLSVASMFLLLSEGETRIRGELAASDTETVTETEDKAEIVGHPV